MANTPDDLAVAEQIDEVCDRFERDFRGGKAPRIESLLAAVSDSQRPALLRALLGLEFELLARAGRTPDPQQFHERFPDDTGLVDEAYASILQAAPTSSKPTSPKASESIRNAMTSVDTSHGGKQRATAAPEALKKLGRFEIRQELGRGAFGTVYRAYDPQLDREVAIKVPLENALVSDDDRRRFLREARSAASLQHPNICPVHEVGTIDGRDYTVMALIDGKPLSKVLESGATLSERQVALAIRKIALALQEAHEKGIIHRDLKSANIMINRKGEPVVMDFGLARRDTPTEAQISVSGQIMGSPAYMSPEQARGESKSVGPQADVYSLGILMYEMLCGRRPFLGNVTEVLGQILHVEPDPPSKHRPGLDPHVEAVCLRAIAKDPTQRFASMSQFAAALSGSLKRPSVPGIRTRESSDVPPKPGSLTTSATTNSAATKPKEAPVAETDHAQTEDTQRLARIVEAVSDNVESKMERAATQAVELAAKRHAPKWWHYAIGSAAMGLILLWGIWFFVRRDNVTVIINIPLDIKDPSLSFVLDKEVIAADTLAAPIELKTGEHELVVNKDYKLFKRFLFNVGKADNQPVVVQDVTPKPSDQGLSDSLRLIFDQPLTAANTLDQLQYSAGWGGKAVVVPDTGLQMGGGNTTPMVWPKKHLGDRYRVQFEAKLNDRGSMLCILNGPGYGCSRNSGYMGNLSRTEFALEREGERIQTVKLPKELVANEWVKLQFDVDAGRITTKVNDSPLEPCVDPKPLSGPLHGWFGLADAVSPGGTVVYRNLRLWSTTQDAQRRPQFTPTLTDQPLANGKLLYEFKISGTNLGPEWWKSHPGLVTVEDRAFVLSGEGTNDSPAVILNHPLMGSVACEIEFEYPTDAALGCRLMLLVAKQVPQSFADCDAGWLASLHSHGAADVWWHRGPTDSHESGGFFTKAPLIANTPNYAPVPRRKYVARIETVDDELRLFLDGGLVLKAKRPNGDTSSANPLFFGLSQYVTRTRIHAIRLYQLEFKEVTGPPERSASSPAYPGPLVFDHPLSKTDTLEHIGSYSGGGVVVVAGTGLRLGGGNSTAIAWPKPFLGDEYRVRLEAQIKHNWVGLIMNGPGYGNSQSTGYWCRFDEKTVLLVREGVVAKTAPLPKPLVLGEWATLQADVRRGQIVITVNDVQVTQFSDAEPLDGPLHGWFGFCGGVSDFRNLQIWTTAKDTGRERQLILPPTEQPRANGELLYELKLAGARELGSEWWASIPKAVEVKDSGLVLSSTGNTPPALVLNKPLSPNVACEIEFEYGTPYAVGFTAMLWSAKNASQSAQECAAGCLVYLPTNGGVGSNGQDGGRYAVQWHNAPKEATENFLGTHAPYQYFTPYHVPIAKRKYLARIEMNRERVRLFMDGGLLFTAKRPNSLPDLPIFLGLRQHGGGVNALKVYAVRVYQIGANGGKKETTAPQVVTDTDRRTAEWAIRVGGMVTNLDGRAQEINKIENLPSRPFKIHAINLSNCREVNDAGLSSLKGLTDLRELWLNETALDGPGLENLKGMTRLEVLELELTRVGDTGLQHLQGLTALRHLDLGAASVTDRGLEYLKGLANLKALGLGGNHITDDGMRFLSEVQNLEFLGLEHTRVTDAGLKHLQKLTKLNELSLWGTNITKSGLRELAPIKSLTNLSLEGTPITDADLTELPAFKNLTILNLRDVKAVSDEGLKHLELLKGLKRLRADGTQATAAGFWKLQQALPNCFVEQAPAKRPD